MKFDETGWWVAFCGFVVAHCPDAPTVLIWISIAVGVAQLGYLYWSTRKKMVECRKIERRKP